MLPHDERGLTLTEMMVVMVMATLVMVGLVTFYLNSQNLWMDGSTQAITQRDATLLLEFMTEKIHRADHATPDLPNHTLVLDTDGQESRFEWHTDDGLMYYTDDRPRGPVVTSRIAKFVFDSDPYMVSIDTLQMAGPPSQSVSLSAKIAFYNPPPPSLP